MTNEQIKDAIAVKIIMIGEYVSRINPLNGDSDPVNAKMMQMISKAEAEIESLEMTLAVRNDAAELRAVG